MVAKKIQSWKNLDERKLQEEKQSNFHYDWGPESAELAAHKSWIEMKTRREHMVEFLK